MKAILEQFYEESVLPARLNHVLDQGFERVGDCIFLRSAFPNAKLPSNDFITKFYKDLSGYEYSINKIHLEDYCEDNLFSASKIFLERFLEKWRREVNESIVATLGFEQHGEFGDISVFSFHKQREMQSIIDLEHIEAYSEPLLAICLPNV
ncbi:hypothetical protein [Caballeronia sp. ATUFL_M2_KS44]|uniref:hypothetical protein n=1 Tax=Caballeronia sp. ATUFL_M2_KS44 TaxID=2921767 RepID=UPI002027D3B9|nr:hypothetical protein [Caballeronia sp. ATUFL_M2_KS44]